MTCRVRFASSLIVLALTLGSQPLQAQWVPNGRSLCTAPDHQFNPTFTSDGNGGAIAAWHDFRNGTNNDIYAQHISSTGVVDGAWPSDGRALSTAPGEQVFPRIISDDAGGAIVTWEDYRGTDTDIYAQRVLATGEADPNWPINGRAVCSAAGNQRYPRIVSDGAGGAIVTWDDYRSGNGDIYAQHVLSSGTLDSAWPVNGTALCTAPEDQKCSDLVGWKSFTIASDGSGGAIVTWMDFRNPPYYHIYAQHVLHGGAVDPTWIINGRPVCTATDNQINPAIVADDAGGAIITWQDFRSGQYNIYAQHVLANGLLDGAWPLNGRGLSGREALDAAIVSDGAGGAIVSCDAMFAQHVLSNGTLDAAWPADGRSLCDSPGYRKFPTMIPDGNGGAIATWFDYRSGNSEVYAQHILSTGALDPQWAVDGTLLCSAPNVLGTYGPNGVPHIVSDGANGAIVVWEDGRSEEGYDIYAQRIFGNGGVAAVSPRNPPSFAVRAPYPNPAQAAGATVSLDLPVTQRVSVNVYDISGQRVRTLVAECDLPAGSQSLIWNGTNDAGAAMSAGMYFVRVTVAGVSVARRISLLR